MKQKPVHLPSLLEETMAPLTTYAAKSRRAVADITERANRIGHCSMVPQQVRQYLRLVEPTEPRFSLGLLFLLVVDELVSDVVLEQTKSGKWQVNETKL